MGILWYIEVMVEAVAKNKTKEMNFAVDGGVRVRFAPSPTGFFHIGSARTALFNYLFSKKNKGAFVLRIEDTDKERSKKEFEEDIIESLKWLGIEIDEGPYRQSERKEVYKEYIKSLIDQDKAYYCFCTPEELEAKRQDQMSRGEAPKYDGKCSKILKEKAEERIKRGESFVIRFRVTPKKIAFDDLIRGKVEFDAGLLGDITIAKDLDTPLYNLAVVIDDNDMGITHIIRGEDLMPNTPKQVLIQEALGFSEVKYGHLPLILGPDRSKLSKRHGATSLREYRDLGYLPEALINFLAFLGWNPGTEKEIFSLKDLINEFSLEKVQKSGAVFNQDRLDYINGYYIRHKSTEEITKLSIPHLVKAGLITPLIKEEKIPATFGGSVLSYNYRVNEAGEEIDIEKMKKIISLYQERMKIVSEISDLVDYFFKEKLEYEKELLVWKKSDLKEVGESLDSLIKTLSSIEIWNLKNIEKELLALADEKGDRGSILWPLRVALSGKKASASPFDIAEVLGQEKTIKRLKMAKNKL